jgi:hypothetical protein
MIVPDTKDWTWVLGRACPQCGFDAGAHPRESIPEFVRENSRVWLRLFGEGVIRPGRPDDATWSNLEYTCHVRDVYQRYLRRIDLMLIEDDPLFDDWDQDASAVADSYEHQDPATVLNELVSAAEAIAARIAEVSGSSWQRPGRRSDGAVFSVETIARYMVHDPIHHAWDVGGDGEEKDRASDS